MASGRVPNTNNTFFIIVYYVNYYPIDITSNDVYELTTFFN